MGNDFKSIIPIGIASGIALYLLSKKASAGPPPPPPPPPDLLMGLAVWSDSFKTILPNPDQWDHFFDVCEAEGVNMVFFKTATRSETEYFPFNDVLEDFIQQANNRGIEIHAFFGSGSWSMIENPVGFKPYIEEILQYNHDFPTAKFSGIVFDVEGGGSPTHEQYQLFANCIDEWRSYDYQGETLDGMILSNYMYVSEAVSPQMQNLFSKLDYWMIVHYRTSYEGVLERNKPYADILEANGMPFFIGYETYEGLPINVSFFELGRDEYVKVKNQVEGFFGTYSNYSGSFLHEWSRAVSTWHTIESVTWLPSAFEQNEEISASVRLQSLDKMGDRLVGVAFIMQDSIGQVFVFSRIIQMASIEEVTVTFELTAPGPSTDGFEQWVALYDLDYTMGTGLVDNYPGNIFTIDLDTLNSTAVQGKRDVFVVLDYESQIAGEPLPVFEWESDTYEPLISQVVASSISSDSVVITWFTNELSTSQVEYGETYQYGNLTPFNDNLVTNHRVEINGLNSGTRYYFRVLSIDPSDNIGVSEMHDFITGSGQLDIEFSPLTPQDGDILSTDEVDIGIVQISDLETSAFIDWNRSLLRYFTFKEGFGGITYDESTYLQTGILENGPEWVEGKRGGCLYFNGEGSRVECGNALELQVTDELTVEMWIRAHDLSTFCCPIGKDLSIGTDGYAIVILGGTPRFYVSNGAAGYGNAAAQSPDGFLLNRWYHVAGVYNRNLSAGNIRIYVDGVLKGLANQPAGIIHAGSTLKIGHGWAGGSPFNGDIDEVKVWNRALSPEEIRASYNCKEYGLVTSYTDLINGDYEFYAHTINLVGIKAQTETRVITIQGYGL